MRHLAVIVVGACLALASSSQAGATPHFLPHGTHLSVKQKVAYFERSIHKDKTAIAFLQHHRQLAGANPTMRWYKAALRWHTHLHVQYSAKLAPPPVVQSYGSNADVVCSVFGSYCSQAISVATCESHLSTYAVNGQYLGMFQMGEYARGRYGHGSDALTQARAAYAYFRDSGYSWSPWECKP